MLKQVRTIDAVAKSRGFAPAAQMLNSTQSVVSRTIASAEKALGRPIFQRGWGGTELTAWGEPVFQRCTNAVKLIARTEHDIAEMSAHRPNLTNLLRWHHLDAVASVVKFGSASLAAKHLGMTQPAVSRAIAAISDYARNPLFERKRAGLESTPAARRLAKLRDDLHRELGTIAEISVAPAREIVGRLAVGMLPFSGQDLVAKAFGELTNSHPELRLMALPSSYDMLADALMRGEIDCIIGILRYPAKYADLTEKFLYHEKYAVVAKHDHPCHARQQTMSSLKDERWIVAQHGTPIRAFFETLFEKEGTIPPTQTCEIHSFGQAEQVIINSNSIGLLAYSDAHIARMRPELLKVNIDLPKAQVDIGLTTRKSDSPTQIIEVFEQALRHFIPA